MKSIRLTSMALTFIGRLALCGAVLITVTTGLYMSHELPQWQGVIWYEHSDHWHVFNIAKNTLQGGISKSIESDVYSRLPSFVPDLVIASSLLVTPLKGLWLQVAYSSIKALLLYWAGGSIISDRLRGVGSRCREEEGWIIWTIVFCSGAMLIPGLIFSFVPIHHGGNAVLTIFGLWLAISSSSSDGRRGISHVFLLFVLSLVGVLSNRLFLISWTIPYVVSCLRTCRDSVVHKSVMASAIGSVIGVAIFEGLRTQGRDSVDIRGIYAALVNSLSLQGVVVSIVMIGVGVGLWKPVSDWLSRGRLKSVGVITGFGLVCYLLSLIASIIVSEGRVEVRYMLPATWVVLILLALWLSIIIQSAKTEYVRWVGLGVVAAIVVGQLGYGSGVTQWQFALSERTNTVLKLLGKEQLSHQHGLAAYPAWQASALYWLSNGEFPLLEASSDSNPLFWHRWKGAYLREGVATSKGISSVSKNDVLDIHYVLVDSQSQRVEKRYGLPDKEVCIVEDASACIWIYDDSTGIRINTATFINTYGDRVKS